MRPHYVSACNAAAKFGSYLNTTLGIQNRRYFDSQTDFTF